MVINGPMGASNLEVRVRLAWHGTTTNSFIRLTIAHVHVKTYKEPHAGAEKSGRVSVKRSWRMDVDGMVAFGAKVGRHHCGLKSTQLASRLHLNKSDGIKCIPLYLRARSGTPDLRRRTVDRGRNGWVGQTTAAVKYLTLLPQ